MIAACAENIAAGVVLLLDTRPPRLSVTAAKAVEPPEDWAVRIEADEPIGAAYLSFIDSSGVPHAVGWEREGDRVLNVLLPTAGLSSDAGVLSGWVADTACNQAAVEVEAVVNRPEPYSVSLSFHKAYGVESSLDRAYEARISFGRVLGARGVLHAE